MTSTRSRLVPSLALALALLGCSTPLAGINPTGAPAAVPAVPAALPSIAAPAGTAPAAPVATPAPAPPMAVDGRVRLQGSVLLQDTPVADASLTAIDLATGKAIALKPWTDAGGGSAGATLRTDAKGAFDLELPKLAADQVVKLVAVSGGQTYAALFDSRGRAIGGSPSAGAKYLLKQGQATLVTIQVRLTAASTAASKAFEGVLKLQFQLPAEQVAANLNKVIEAAQKAATEIETALAKKPELASSLVNSVGAQGEIGDIDKFRTAVANLGIFDKLFNSVEAELKTVTAMKLAAREGAEAITAEDFPLDRVTITQGGGLLFGNLTTPIQIGGAVTNNFVPTPSRGGGSSVAAAPTHTHTTITYLQGDAPFTGNLSRAMGLGVYDASTADFGSYVLVGQNSSGNRLHIFDADGNFVASASHPEGRSWAGVAQAEAGSTTLMLNSNTALYRLARVPGPTWAFNVVASIPIPNLYGGVVSGGRFFAIQDVGNGNIYSFPVTGDLSASEVLPLPGGVSNLSSVTGRPVGSQLADAWAIAASANQTATHVYWGGWAGDLWRYSFDGTTATLDRIATHTFGGFGYVGVAMASGTRLYYAVDNSPHQKYYYIDNPASGTTVTPIQFATTTYGNVYPFGGAQARPGSVVFAMYQSFANATGVVRIPTP